MPIIIILKANPTLGLARLLLLQKKLATGSVRGREISSCHTQTWLDGFSCSVI